MTIEEGHVCSDGYTDGCTNGCTYIKRTSQAVQPACYHVAALQTRSGGASGPRVVIVIIVIFIIVIVIVVIIIVIVIIHQFIITIIIINRRSGIYLYIPYLPRSKTGTIFKEMKVF